MSERKYQMIRIAKGDYLLPSNDASVLWRICSYEEDGSAEDFNGRRITGTWWATYRWDGGFPTEDQLMAAYESDDWAMWEHWSGAHKTRSEALQVALAVAA